METFLAIMSFITLHWWWISIFLMGAFFGLKILALKSPWTWDDKVVTFIIGLIRMSRGKEPLSTVKKQEIEDRIDIKKKEIEKDRKLYPKFKDRGEELEQ